jgi:hypothetical protein
MNKRFIYLFIPFLLDGSRIRCDDFLNNCSFSFGLDHKLSLGMTTDPPLFDTEMVFTLYYIRSTKIILLIVCCYCYSTYVLVLVFIFQFVL